MFAILLGEPSGAACTAALAEAETILLSAGSLTEMLIVAARKNLAEETDVFLDAIQPTIVPVTAESARAARDGYRLWGKGFHDAKLNFGDSFAYALAMEHRCPLLFVGDDFARTDVGRAM